MIKIKPDDFAKTISSMVEEFADKTVRNISRDIEENGVTMDVTCQVCGGMIENAVLKNNSNFVCPHCKIEFPVNLNTEALKYQKG